jgi:hypothetical protein
MIASIVITAVLIIWGIVYLITYRQYVPVSVQYIGWDTQIDIQQYMTVHEGDWYVPYGGRETNSYIRQRSTERYLAGYETKTRTIKGSCTTVGTGKNQRKSCTSDRIETVREAIYKTRPVYDRWYEYDIDRWVNVQPLQARGSGHDWYMPDTSDGTYIDSPNIGNKRLGLNRTHFYIVFGNNNKQYSADMPVERWKTHNMGEQYELTLNWVGGIIEIKKAGTW